MTNPIVTFFQSNDTTQFTTANPINLGNVGAGSEGTPVTVNVWNHKGGTTNKAKMFDVQATTVTVNGFYSGDTISNGKNVVEMKYVQIALNDGIDTYLAVGGATMKNLPTIRGDRLNTPTGVPTGTPGVGEGNVAAGTYYYRVSALDETGETRCGTESAAVIVGTPNNQVSLTWTAVPDASSYKVFRTTTAGSYGANSLILNVATNSHLDVAASPTTGQPLETQTCTFGHKRSIFLRASPPTNASGGIQNWNLRVLYKYVL